MLYLVILAAAGLVILGAVIAYLTLGSSGSSASTISSSVCNERSYPGLSPKHLSNPDKKVKYNSFPPSSGPHYQQPAPWGIYEEPIRQTILVHNLEHGGIIVQYGKVGSDAISEVRSFYQDDPNGLVVAPYPKLGTKFVLTAWNEPAYRAEGDFSNVKAGRGFVLTCTKFDGKTFAKFRNAHRNKSGERYPSVKDMAPGN
ncbi:MAG: DUF3105 domain-containing protein [Actinomycetota bacterium]